MNKVPTVKILVAYHKPAALIKNDIFVPIHLGRSLATKITKDGTMNDKDYQWLLDNMIGDDTGDNISCLNRHLNEMTAVYWAWKNYDKLDNPDYIGLCHYRRFWDFDADLNDPKVNNGIIYEEFFNKNLISTYEKNPDKIRKEIGKFDIIHGCLKNDLKTELQWFLKLCAPTPGSGAKADIFYEIIDNYIPQHFPNLAVTAKEYVNDKKHYWYNCFIMKKKLFFEYCEFIFSILLYFENKINYDELSVNGQRTLGYVSERLLGIFITSKLTEQKKIGYKPIVFIKNTDIFQDIAPAFEKNNVAVFCSADDNFAAYCCVTLKSIIENGSAENNYDLIVLEEKLSKPNKDKILSLQSGRNNVSIRFYNVSHLLNGKSFHLSPRLSMTTYYRFFAASIFKDYDKIIYLDADTIVLTDIAQLYKQDIKDNLLMGANDIGLVANMTAGNPSRKYFEDTVGVKNPADNYFQAGVLVFNVKEFIKQNTEEELLKVASENKFDFHDQDTLNKVCFQKVSFMDSSWNVPSDAGGKKGILPIIPAKYYEKYLEDRKKPKIIHYSGYEKPWEFPDSDMASFWWRYARMTPFYEDILFLNMQKKIPSPEMLGDIFHYTKNKFKYWRYKILSQITFGKRRQKYKQKRDDLKKRLRDVRWFLNK